MTLTEGIANSPATPEVLSTLALLSIDYFGFDGEVHTGQLVVAKEVANDVTAIFGVLLKHSFPIERMVPIVRYGWDDLLSVQDNNSSSFNYRFVAGTTRLSNHSFGKALDINPKTNPYIGKNGTAWPSGLTYDQTAKGVIVDGDIVVKTFLSFGWEWGGHWHPTRGYVDYQHFQKTDGHSL